MKLDEKAFGLACGIMWGALVFLASLSVYLRDGTGEITGRLARFYIGYDPSTFLGAFVGLIYGFISALIIGLIFAVVYNAFTVKRVVEKETIER